MIEYYSKYEGDSNGFITALKELKIDSSLSNRRSIAELNGIESYDNTPAQNRQLLNLLKDGLLIKNVSADAAGGVSGGERIRIVDKSVQVAFNNITSSRPASITTKSAVPTQVEQSNGLDDCSSLIDALKYRGINATLQNRCNIARKNGEPFYIGTPEQDTKLLNLLKSGRLVL